jgi:hypothetical protein
MRGFFLFVCLTGLVSCSLRQGTYDKTYLDIDSLLNQQVSLLAHRPIRVEKSARIGQEESISTSTLDSISFTKELEVFRQVDAINKPGFRDEYEIQERADTKSNLTVRSYLSRGRGNIPAVRFYFLNDLRHLKKMEATVNENNPLFASVRNLTMEFDQVGDQTILTSYQMEGVQKMTLSDTVRYSVKTHILE